MNGRNGEAIYTLPEGGARIRDKPTWSTSCMRPSTPTAGAHGPISPCRFEAILPFVDGNGRTRPGAQAAVAGRSPVAFLAK